MMRPRRTGGFRPGGMAFGGFGGRFGLTLWVKRLLIANAAVFLLMALGALPGGWTIRHFGFSVGTVLTHPWTPLTYMFLHGGFWHLFVNMLAVFFFGPPLERAWGGRAFLRFYLVAGVGGALFSLLLWPWVGAGLVIGASGAVFGLLLAFALKWPDAPIYIWGVLPVPAKWFVTVLGAFAVFATISGGGDGVAHWAHLGGLVTGYAYLRWGEAWSRAAAWERVRRRLGSLGRKDASRRPGRGPELRPPGGAAAGRRSGESGDRRGRRGGGSGVDGDTLDRVDAILDKIREGGMDSLTDEERELLDELSRRYQRAP